MNEPIFESDDAIKVDLATVEDRMIATYVPEADTMTRDEAVKLAFERSDKANQEFLASLTDDADQEFLAHLNNEAEDV